MQPIKTWNDVRNDFEDEMFREVPVSSVKTMAKDEFKTALLGAGGFQTGSRAWYCHGADSDDDVVVTPAMFNRAADGDTVVVDGVEFENCIPPNYSDNIKIGKNPVLNVIIADPEEFPVWEFATKAMTIMPGIPMCFNKKRRIAVFELLRVACRIAGGT